MYRNPDISGASFPPAKRRIAPCLPLLVAVSICVLHAGFRALAADHLRISEFCAANVQSLTDPDGEHPDWIELHNPSQKKLNLADYYITDDPTAPTKKRLPFHILQPGERAILLASGKSIESIRPPFHVPFKLSSSGEFLALISFQTSKPVQTFAGGFPKQYPDLSYGIPKSAESEEDARLAYDYLEAPTPGQPNTAAGTPKQVSPPSFSVERGFYHQPLRLELVAPSPESFLLYTTDGSAPSPTNGQTYARPIEIQTTTIVRALAIEDDQESPIATHSYLFPKAITQQKKPTGFPDRWGDVKADYAMDPRITSDPKYQPRIESALTSLPSISLNTDFDGLFGARRGIYSNPTQQGIDWERPTSMEWIEASGRTIQCNAGLRIQGGWFRGPNTTRKHSFRLLFKRSYGPASLKFDLFQEFGAAKEFETLILRAGANDGYTWKEAKGTEQFIRDEYGRRLTLALGQPAPRGRFVHLYLNGCYWGLYNLCERPNEDFSASYRGGEAEGWDAINTGTVKHGSRDAWEDLENEVRKVHNSETYLKFQGRDLTGQANPKFKTWLTTDHYIDYLLPNLWLGNADWPDKNYWLGWNRRNSRLGYQFYPWDLEITLGNNRARSPLDFQAPAAHAIESGATLPHFWLLNNRDYRSDFADRVHKHLFHDKTLSIASLRALYQDLAAKVRPAIVAEAARWGDDQFDEPRDPADWDRERDWILDNYLLKRGPIVLDQLRSSGLFPRIDAPIITPNNGKLNAEEPLTILSTEPEVFYTIDAPDPRLPGGELHPEAHKFTGNQTTPLRETYTLIDKNSIWRYATNSISSTTNWAPERLIETAKWTAGWAPLGRDSKKIQTTISRQSPDSSPQKNPPYLLMKQFSLPRKLPFETLKLWIDCSDSLAVYLNNESIFRSSSLPNRNSNHPYSSANSESKVPVEAKIPALNLLRQGQNQLVVVVHSRSAADQSLHFDLALTAIPPPGIKQILIGTLATQDHGTLRMRARKETTWSALVEFPFTQGIPVPDKGHLLISELNFDPAEPTSPSEQRAARRASDFEYLKLSSTHPAKLDLSDLRIQGGIEFEFPTPSILPPQGSIYLVKNPSAFRARFGDGVSVAGEFRGRLNNAGESVSLITRDGNALDTVNYSRSAPWPETFGKKGYILTRKIPLNQEIPADLETWEARPETRLSPPQATDQ